MEYIEGGTLTEEKYLSFSVGTRKKICSRLSEQLRLLRAIPAEGYYGRVHRQAWLGGGVFINMRSRLPSDPYDTYENFISDACANAQVSRALGGSREEWNAKDVEYLSKMERILRNCTGMMPTFTHVSPALQNIIVKPLGGSGEDAVDWEVTLIDWANRGWFPAWAQAVTLNDRFYLSTPDQVDHRPELDEAMEVFCANFEESYSEQIALFDELEEKLFYRFS